MGVPKENSNKIIIGRHLLQLIIDNKDEIETSEVAKDLELTPKKITDIVGSTYTGMFKQSRGKISPIFNLAYADGRDKFIDDFRESIEILENYVERGENRPSLTGGEYSNIPGFRGRWK